MDQLPSSLRKLIKRAIQYFGVVITSLIVGGFYVSSLRFGAPTTSFLVCFSGALISAFLIWRWLDRRIVFVSRPRVIAYNTIPTRGYAMDSAAMLVSGTFVVIMVVGGTASGPFPSAHQNTSCGVIIVPTIPNAATT